MSETQHEEIQRMSARRDLLYYLDVFDAQANQFIGKLVDITPNGFMVNCNQNMPSGSMHPLRIDIPDDFEEILQTITVDAEVKWCRKGKDNQIGAGFFVKHPSEEFGRLAEFFGVEQD